MGIKYKNQEIISNTHIAIINPEEAAQIDRLLRRNSLLAPRTASAPRSLAGLVFCESCQLSMTISHVTQRNKKQEYLYLRCPQCPKSPKCKSINYQDFLNKTIEGICQELPIAVNNLIKQDKKSIQNNIVTALTENKTILTQIQELQNQGILDPETATLRNYKLKLEISKLEDKIAQLPPQNLQAIANTVSFPQFWFDLSEAERRFYFREFIKQILIMRCEPNQWNIQLVFIF